MNDQRIEELLQRLIGYVIRLRKISETTIDDFINNENEIAAAERILQFAIETKINIGNRIWSINQTDVQISIPENYSDIFRSLVRLNIIETDKLDNFIKMVKFRNQLVHGCWDIDSTLLHTYLKDNIIDFEYFFRRIIDFLNVRRK